MIKYCSVVLKLDSIIIIIIIIVIVGSNRIWMNGWMVGRICCCWMNGWIVLNRHHHQWIVRIFHCRHLLHLHFFSYGFLVRIWRFFSFGWSVERIVVWLKVNKEQQNKRYSSLVFFHLGLLSCNGCVCVCVFGWLMFGWWRWWWSIVWNEL